MLKILNLSQNRRETFSFSLLRNTRYEIRDTISTIVENPLQIAPFLQNKANFQQSQMNVILYNTRDYENISDWTLGENKPNSNPIKPNCRKGEIDAKCLLTKEYEEKCG